MAITFHAAFVLLLCTLSAEKRQSHAPLTQLSATHPPQAACSCSSAHTQVVRLSHAAHRLSFLLCLHLPM